MNSVYHQNIKARCPQPVPFYVYDSVGSTNDLLRDLAAAGAPEFTTVIARQQTAGRGRQGRKFFSPPDTGLYFSMLFRPQGTPQQILSLTPMSAVAAAEAIEAYTGEAVQIKWVNDLLLHGKKICGILAESSFSRGREVPDHVIVGIGINLRTPPSGFPEELRDIAGAVLPEEADTKEAFCGIAAGMITALTKHYAGLQEKQYLAGYRERLCVLNRQVTVMENGKETPAQALAVDDDLRLLVRYPDGSEQWRATGEIRIKL